MPSARETCDRLIEAVTELENSPLPDDPSRRSLLESAAEDPECAPLLMEMVRHEVGARPSAALAGAAAAVEIARLRQDPRGEAEAGRIKGQALRALGRHEEAVSALRGAAEVAKRAGDRGLAALVQIGAIDSLGMLARYDEAFALADRLERDLIAAGDEQASARVLVNAGGLHFRRDHYDEALDCYQRAGEILARGSDPAAAATVWTNQANILTQRNRVEEALGLYERARAVFQERGLDTEAAVVDLNAGFLHYASGRHTAALAALTRAHNAFSRSGRLHLAHRCAVDRGDVHRALNLHAEALADYEAAIEGFTGLPSDYDLARAQVGRAAVLIAQGTRHEAPGALDAASHIFRRQRNSVQQAHVNLIRAHLFHADRLPEDARRAARAAQVVFARRKLHGWAAEARFEAQPTPIVSATVARSVRDVAKSARETGRGWLECRAELVLGRYYAAQGQTPTALRRLRAAAAALERTRSLVATEQMHLSFVRGKLAVYEDLVELLLQRGRPGDVDEALGYAERSRSRLLLDRLLSSLASTEVEGIPGAGIDPLRARVEALRAELSRAYYVEDVLDAGDPRRRLTPASGSAGGRSLACLEAEYRGALLQWDLCGGGAGRTPAPTASAPPARDLLKAISPEEVLVEYYRANGRLYVFLAREGSVQARELDADPGAVERALRKLRYHVQRLAASDDYLSIHLSQLRTGFDEALGRLYDLLWRPIENALDTEKVVVVPHGPLHAVPFHALLDITRKQYVLDRWELVALPSASVRPARAADDRKRTARGGSPALLVGVPAPGLEQIAVETERLGKLLPGAQTLSGRAATLEAFCEAAGGARLLHIATHARFREDNPLFSGLRFADGWLLARDLYEMTLGCDLATLSACSTGQSQIEVGDEQFGLVRGFLAAGARSVAVSLWPVEDRSTAALMEHFYRELAAGRPNASALRAAQQAMRESGAHPAHWAAFMLVGER